MMSAPFNGTKTRVVGFLKGLFGKGNSAETEAVRDDVVYDYNQVTPVTGAQLKPPTAATPVVRTTAGNHKPAIVPAPQRSATSPAVKTPVAQPLARQAGHVAGVVVTPPVVGTKPAVAATAPAPSAPIPIAIKLGDNNGIPAPVAPAVKSASTPPSGKCLNLPLAALVAAMPPELKTRVTKNNFGDHAVAIPFEIVFEQLASGVVKIPFVLIRENAPQFFAPAADADHIQFTLPLGEILRQINPAQLAKSTGQVRITADADVTSPFAEKGNNANLEVKSSTPTRTITPDPAPTISPRQTVGEIPKPVAPPANVPTPIRINVPATPVASAPPTPSAPISMPKVQAPAPKPAVAPTPSAPPTPSEPIAMPKAQVATRNPVPAPAPIAAPTPKINSVASLRMVSTPSKPTPASAAAPTQAMAPTPAVTPVPALASAPATAQPGLIIALKSLVNAWPEPVKAELTEQNLVNGSVALPLESVGEQLKNGRVAFTWDLIRSWITPRPTGESAHGSVELELPLMVIAPAFLGLKNKGGATNVQRLAADDQIPNVFAQVAKPAAEAAPAPTPTAPVATPQPAPAPAPMTPEAVVKRAAALNGVAGALIALPDGLVVASKLPAGQSADSLAAFLPQIYAKFDSCLKDLKMDGLNNLNFTAGNVPWRVFRTSSVLFAVFGRANETLPNDWLATLAGELEKK